MKIIQVTAAYKPAYIYGGPTMSVSKLCEAVSKQVTNNKEKQGKSNDQEAKVEDSINIEVFTTTANGKTELNVNPNQSTIVDNVRVTYFKRLTKDHTHFSPALLWNLHKSIKLSSIAKSKNSAVGKDLMLHIHAWWNLVSVFSCLLAKWYNVPVLLSPRGMLTNYTSQNRNSLLKSIIHNFLGKQLLRYCHIHATSEQEKLDVLSIIKPKSITVVPNLVQLQDNLEIQHKQEGDHVYKLIFLSRIEEKKGLELLFNALTGFDVDWSLTIAGSGDEKYVESLKVKAESLGLNKKIDWLGQVGNKDKFSLLAQHDLMVLSSYNENFANVVIESLSVGTPVLVSENVGLADYVKEKDFGWVSNLDEESIRNVFNLSYSAKHKREQIRSKAPDQITNDFNDQILAEKYIHLYKTLFSV